MLLLSLACSEPITTEPLELPADQSAAGVPVGVRTVSSGDVTFEVWYPATDATAGEPGEAADPLQFIPQVFLDTVDDFDMPLLQTDAVRDAPVRDTGEPLRVVLFSHGFGGFRLQSHSLTAHLASRGYVVIAPDHPGRMMGDVLPCLFSPALEGCDLTGFFSDPALEDLEEALAWAEAGPEWLSLDLDGVGLSGHSAGGGSTTTLGEEDSRFTALLPMAGAGPVSRAVPTLIIDGTCDGIVPTGSTQEAADSSADADIAHLAGAGHLAFTDLCDLDLLGLADEVLADRDDLNAAFYDQLLALGSDGCPGVVPAVDSPDCATAYLDEETASRTLRYGMTAFFDAHLRGSGDVSFTDYPAVY
jgi:dienelactone hydrolase